MVMSYMSLQPIYYYLFGNETQVGYRPVIFQFVFRERCFKVVVSHKLLRKFP